MNIKPNFKQENDGLVNIIQTKQYNEDEKYELSERDYIKSTQITHYRNITGKCKRKLDIKA